MQNVSTLYKAAMLMPLREPSYMRVTLGVINHEAQDAATVTHGETVGFSDDAVVGALPKESSYAGFDCASVSGRQILLPESGEAVNTGLVSEGIVSESPFTLEMQFSMPVDVKGMTLTFDENAYPTAFTVATDNGETAYENAGALWVTEDAFLYITYLRITFTEMSLETARLRLKSLALGYGLTYTNDDILNSEWKAYASEVSEDMPQVDFSVTLKNYDHYFDTDNPSSVIHFLDTDMPIQVHYGMTLETGAVEWFQAAQCYLSEWSADERQAVITAADVLRTMESEYYKGRYYADGVSLYALAGEVFADAGVSEYYIDPSLKEIFTKNPLPRVPHKEALQIIANAARCTLGIGRTGMPTITSTVLPDVALSVNEQAPWSHAENIVDEAEKQRYAVLNTDYTSASAKMVFLPPEDGGYDLYTGFISAEISGEDCTFAAPPTIIAVQEPAVQRAGLTLRFGAVTPARMFIETYKGGEQVEYHTIDVRDRETRLSITFRAFDTMYIRFIETAKPYQPVEVEYVHFGRITDFVMTKNEMLSYPVTTNNKAIRQIDAAAFFYNDGTVSDTLFNDTITAQAGAELDVFLTEPSYGYAAEIESGETAEIVESGAYYVRVRFAQAGTFKLKITGYKYTVTTSLHSEVIRQKGEVKVWENPLISDISEAARLAQWLSAYYASDILYEYETRGNPELDPSDTIYQENQYVPNMMVRVCEQTVRFNGSLSGKLVTKRVT